MNMAHYKVCSGAGCKAWGSIELARELKCVLENQEGVEFIIELAPCMNSCGGGVSVKSSGCDKKLYKFRTVDEALELLEGKGLLTFTNV